MPMAAARRQKSMNPASTFLAGFKGVSSVLMGRETVREAVKTMHHARIALIGIAVAAGVAAVCFLIITAYIGLLLVQELSAL